jgi:hypothetical protein
MYYKYCKLQDSVSHQMKLLAVSSKEGLFNNTIVIIKIIICKLMICNVQEWTFRFYTNVFTAMTQQWAVVTKLRTSEAVILLTLTRI